MKKTIFILSILFSINCMGQDTTYSYSKGLFKKNDLYMSIRTKVTDSTTFNRYWTIKKKKRRRNDKIFSIVTTSIFVGISIWYWK